MQSGTTWVIDRFNVLVHAMSFNNHAPNDPAALQWTGRSFAVVSRVKYPKNKYWARRTARWGQGGLQHVYLKSLSFAGIFSFVYEGIQKLVAHLEHVTSRCSGIHRYCRPWCMIRVDAKVIQGCWRIRAYSGNNVGCLKNLEKFPEYPHPTLKLNALVWYKKGLESL